MKQSSLIALPLIAAVLFLVTPAHAQNSAAGPAADPRIGLEPGIHDAGTAAWNMELVAHLPKPEGFVGPGGPASGLFSNSDMAFQGDRVFIGSFMGFNIYDISDPANPKLETSVICPGGQGDLSVHGDLMFMSVEMPNGRVDCEQGQMTMTADPDRFRGVRIWDISDIDDPEQVATIQTCRGSHTHTLVTDPNDDEHVYIYVSGTSFVRPEAELPGCVGADPSEDPNSALFRIEVIRVPVDSPEDAEIVGTPRIFATETGDPEGLWPGGEHGPNTQQTARTDQCHDITAFPELGIAAGACSGNGILLDISDPANPVRIDEVVDPNFAYWHSATLNNDGSKVIFTDEWGGGGEARCREQDPANWGANAIFERVDGELELRGYYKLPVVQTAEENCVAHNGSLVPVPGRDIMAQAWYQGGVSVFDFTDPTNPVEIAFFDRGPMTAAGELQLGGVWSTYWYNGYLYSSEMGRGLDVLELTPSEHLSENEIAAANLVRLNVQNVQHQQRFDWPGEPVVAHALLDQLERENVGNAASVRTELDAALALAGQARSAALTTLADRIEQGAGWAPAGDAKRLRFLAETLREIAAA